MGFLSKLMKNPLVQMALPFAMTMFMPGMGTAFASKFPAMSGIFSGMNPMAANMLKQSALGYGTAALSGSKRPEKAAMYAGLASLPFSYMSASQAANAFNQQHAGTKGWEKYLDPSVGKIAGGPAGMTSWKPQYGFREFGAATPRVSAWDILKGDYAKGYQLPPDLVEAGALDKAGTYMNTPEGRFRVKVAPGENIPLDADIFSKTSPGGTGFGGVKRPPIGTKTVDWMPTMASQAAAMYGGSMTDEEKWEEAQKRRKKELAWMYGVPEDMIEGEMTNPWSSGRFWNRGGIASLENGGDVSGPGTGTSDSINANLSDGEFVMTAKAVENLGGGDRYAGARKMYDLMNVLDPESETMSEVV